MTKYKPGVISHKAKFIAQIIHPKNIKKAYQVIRRSGAKDFVRRLRAKFRYHPARRQHEYQEFLYATRPTESELAKQRQTIFEYRPCIGVIIPLYNTKLEYLQDLLDSFKAQTYPNFKLFMVDASPNKNGKTSLTAFIQNEVKNDHRFIYQILEKNEGIASNTNQAIKLALQDASIDYIALCDHDDFIEPNALFEYVKVINQNPNIRIIYSDEDVVKYKNDPEASYVMKPDFDPFLIESCNYINHFFVCEKSLLEEVKTENGLYEQPEYDGAQDYDLYLRLIEKALEIDRTLKEQSIEKTRTAIYTSSTIFHIPKVLYHWRAAENSTAQDPHNKIYAYDAGKRALEAHFRRQKINIDSVDHTKAIGTYRTKYYLETEPLVSVVIQCYHNRSVDVQKVVKSIQNGTYQNLEFIIAEDNSVVKNAKGSILLFIDSNITMLNQNSISEMVAIIEREGVGTVGAQLLFSNGTIRHAGMTIDCNGGVNRIFYRSHPDFTYGNRANCVSSYSVVSSECLMIKKDLYRQLGGFNYDLSTSLKDLDFCLKIRALGKLIIYTPYAKFSYHKDKKLKHSASNKSAEEIKFLCDQWPAICQNGDPYYNRNFNFHCCDCSLSKN